MKNNKFILSIILSVLMPFSAILAKGFSSSSSGFSSRSSSSGFSSGRSSSSSSSGKSSFSSSSSSSSSNGVKSPFSSSSSGKSSFSNSNSSKPKTSFDYAQQRQSLTPPKPKNEYVNDFKAKNANKYPTTFDSKPTTRPSYIPPTTTYNGASRPIEYNPATRSYGFFDDLGKFMIYDAITDIALNNFKNDEKIYVQNVSELNKQEAVDLQQENEQSGVATFFLWFFGIIIGIMIIGCILASLDL